MVPIPSLKSQNAIKNFHNSRYCLIFSRVFFTLLKPIAAYFFTSKISFLFSGSGKYLKVGIENKNHQIDTVTKLNLVAIKVPFIPNKEGFEIIKRFIARSIPPPRYPAE